MCTLKKNTRDASTKQNVVGRGERGLGATSEGVLEMEGLETERDGKWKRSVCRLQKKELGGEKKKGLVHPRPLGE